MTIVAIADMPINIKTVEYLRHELSGMDKYDIESIRPHILILKITFDIIKIVTLIIGLLFTLKWTNNPRITFVSLLLIVLTFLYFDLPIHRCDSDNFETYWELGRHYH